LIEEPGDFFRKAYVSTRLGLGIAPLRALVRQYLGNPGIRRRVRYDDLMNDLLKLDIVRRARRGILKAHQPFLLSVDFDAEAGMIVLTSRALRQPDHAAVGESRPHPHPPRPTRL